MSHRHVRPGLFVFVFAFMRASSACWRVALMPTAPPPKTICITGQWPSPWPTSCQSKLRLTSVLLAS